MSDDKSGSDANDNINNLQDKAGDEAGSGKKTESSSSSFDVSSIGDEDFDKVFDDPRIFKHPRFKQLSERAKKAAELEKQQEESERKKLKDQQKWQELAEKTEAEKKELETRYQTTLIDMKIQAEAMRLGAVDTEAVAKLIDRSGIALDDAGNVTGIDEALAKLTESKSYLFSEGKPNKLGNATNPGSDGNKGSRRFTLSQIQDPIFYSENEQEILIALKQGTITNDL